MNQKILNTLMSIVLGISLLILEVITYKLIYGLTLIKDCDFTFFITGTQILIIYYVFSLFNPFNNIPVTPRLFLDQLPP